MGSAALADSAKVVVWRERYSLPRSVDHDFPRRNHVDVLDVPGGYLRGFHLTAY